MQGLEAKVNSTKSAKIIRIANKNKTDLLSQIFSVKSYGLSEFDFFKILHINSALFYNMILPKIYEERIKQKLLKIFAKHGNLRDFKKVIELYNISFENDNIDVFEIFQIACSYGHVKLVHYIYINNPRKLTEKIVFNPKKRTWEEKEIEWFADWEILHRNIIKRQHINVINYLFDRFYMTYNKLKDINYINVYLSLIQIFDSDKVLNHLITIFPQIINDNIKLINRYYKDYQYNHKCLKYLLFQNIIKLEDITIKNKNVIFTDICCNNYYKELEYFNNLGILTNNNIKEIIEFNRYREFNIYRDQMQINEPFYIANFYNDGDLEYKIIHKNKYQILDYLIKNNIMQKDLFIKYINIENLISPKCRLNMPKMILKVLYNNNYINSTKIRYYFTIDDFAPLIKLIIDNDKSYIKYLYDINAIDDDILKELIKLTNSDMVKSLLMTS